MDPIIQDMLLKMRLNQVTILSSISGGIFSHLLLFIHGEWDRFSALIVQAYCALHLVAWAYFFFIEGLSPQKATGTLTFTSAFYFTGLFSSILAYRAFFHPLRRFKGPLAAGLTSLWSVRKSLPRMQWNLVVHSLHGQYGDFVRIRSREISINHPDALRVIYGSRSKCLKGPFYDSSYPDVSLHSMRSRVAHNQRRRVWDRGFNVKSLNDYQPRIAKHTARLLSQLTSHTLKPINATQWFNYFGFDVMGDLAFGKDFGMLETGQTHFVLEKLHERMQAAGVLSGAPWIFRILKMIPGMGSKERKWLGWVKCQVEERKRMTLDLPDVFSWLVDSSAQQEKCSEVLADDLVRDAELIIVAGSDTTSATLANVFFLLSQNPEKARALQLEVDRFRVNEDSGIDYKDANEMPFLEGVINEALRLFPPVPSGLPRLTPAEGITIGDVFIPGNTIVSVPTHTMHRDPRNYARPNEFIPERWSSQPELILKKDTFGPFSIGTYSCVGKLLALAELRTVISSICQKLDVRFANDKSEVIFMEDPGPKDTFTTTIAPLSLIFTERK